MPITIDERDSLRQLVDFTKTELADAGDPNNNLNNLQALTDQRLAEYQASVDTDEAALWVLINADATGEVHNFWEAAQDGVWVRLDAQLSFQDQVTLFGSADTRVKRLAKSLPKLAALTWTLTNFNAG